MPACLQGENERDAKADEKAQACVCVSVCWISAGEGVAALALPIPHHSRRPDCLTARPHSRNGTSCCCCDPLDCWLARPSPCSPAPECGFHWSLARNCSFFVGGLFKASSELPDVDD